MQVAPDSSESLSPHRSSMVPQLALSAQVGVVTTNRNAVAGQALDVDGAAVERTDTIGEECASVFGEPFEWTPIMMLTK